MKLSSLFRPGFFQSRLAPIQPPTTTASQEGRKARIAWKLIMQGYITLREIADMGDNHPTKTVLRLRRDGLLYPKADDPRGFRMASNASGEGEHKVYLWTKNMPRGGKMVDRRKKARGGRA